MAAARNGLSVIMTEETDWIGGQLTQQAVPPDEHPWIEKFGATQSYRSYRNQIRSYYRTWYPVRAEFNHDPAFNPGACAVSYLCHEPHAAHAVLLGMLAPYISSGRLTVLLDTVPVQAEGSQDRVSSVQVRHTPSETTYTLEGQYFIDATELGDLLPLSNTEYVTGAESQTQTGELHAPAEAQPHNMQAMTWCFAIDYQCMEKIIPSTKPAGYDQLGKTYVPRYDIRPGPA